MTLTRRTPLRTRSLKLQRAMTIYRREVRLFLAEHNEYAETETGAALDCGWLIRIEGVAP